MEKDKTNKNFWQRVAKIYNMTRDDEAYDAICESLSPYIDRDKKVLELACGTGQITFRMAQKSGAWEATDYSENMVAQARKRGLAGAGSGHVAFCVQDATNLAYKDETFDVVVIANALHIMPAPDLAMKEIDRVLKKDGILFAPTFVYEKGYSKCGMWMLERVGFKAYHKWTKDAFAEYVCGRGFEVIKLELVEGKMLPECVLVGRKIE